MFFGEPLPQEFFVKSKDDLKGCDLLIVMGTSLSVFPFATLVEKVDYGCHRLLVNRELVGPFKDVDPLKERRDYVYQGSIDDFSLKFASLLEFDSELLDMQREGNNSIQQNKEVDIKL